MVALPALLCVDKMAARAVTTRNRNGDDRFDFRYSSAPLDATLADETRGLPQAMTTDEPLRASGERQAFAGFARSEFDEIISDAETSVGRSMEERARIFSSVQALIAAVWSRLSEDEIRRRLDIADLLDPRPDPWWRNIKPEGCREGSRGSARSGGRSRGLIKAEIFVPFLPLQASMLGRAVRVRLRDREVLITSAEDLSLPDAREASVARGIRPSSGTVRRPIQSDP
jgi:hypothetical protein